MANPGQPVNCTHDFNTITGATVKSLKNYRQGDGGESGGRKVGFVEDCFLKAQSGDLRARNDLCAYVWKVAYRKALLLPLPGVYEAADYAQDVVIRLLEQLPQIRNLKFWLVRVLIGAQATAYRKYHQKLISSSEMLLDKDDDNFEARELAVLEVENIFAQLAPVERDILFLRQMDGRSFAEIAEIMHMSEGALRTQYWRTKLKLQKRLGSQAGEGIPNGTFTR